MSVPDSVPVPETEMEMEMELLPPRSGIRYKPHQVVGIRWMLARERADAPWCCGGVLADDMGLGKTFQTIGLLLNAEKTELRSLIVCPPALVAGWKAELTACGFFVCTLFDGVSEWIPVPKTHTGPIVCLITYPRLCIVYKTLVRSAAGRFDRIILDEGHVIRNGPDTARGLACLVMSRFAKRRWILSATPVQNGYKDWIHLCQWLGFRGKRAEMAEAAGDIMLRRTMEELRVTGEMPAAPVFVVRDLHIPPVASSDSSAKSKTRVTDSEYDYFHRLCDQLDDIVDDREVSALVKLELYMRIQQFLVHPQIYIQSRRDSLGSAFPRGDWTGGATKWAACVEGDLAEAVREREGAIVFCQFRYEMDRVAAAAVAMGAKVWSVRGGMSAAEIGAAVEGGRAAVAAGEAVVMVVQIVSGGVGLNLQFCRRVLFLSQHWNPAVVHQAVGRAVRIGQMGVVRVFMYRVVDDVMDNLDLRMTEVHSGKIGVARELCSSFYEGFGGAASAAPTEPTFSRAERRAGGPAKLDLPSASAATAATVFPQERLPAKLERLLTQSDSRTVVTTDLPSASAATAATVLPSASAATVTEMKKTIIHPTHTVSATVTVAHESEDDHDNDNDHDPA